MSSQGIGSDGGTPQQREHDDGCLQTGREKSPGGIRNISMPNNNKKIYQMYRKTMPHTGVGVGNGIMQRQKLHFFSLLLRPLGIGDTFQKAKDSSNMGESPMSPERPGSQNGQAGMLHHYQTISTIRRN